MNEKKRLIRFKNGKWDLAPNSQVRLCNFFSSDSVHL